MAKKDKNDSISSYPIKPTAEPEPDEKPHSSTTAAPDFDSVFNSLVEAYSPELIDYEPVDGETLSSQIALWLRPAYEQSIDERERRTERDNAELDADAIARGMGGSTYVTDVKNRNFLDEAEDIAYIETEYGAALAKHLFDALEADRERASEAEAFNANAKNEAYQQAFNAATALYATYQSGGSSGGGGSGGGKGGGKTESETDGSTDRAELAKKAFERLFGAIATPNKEDSYRLLNSMSPAERRRVFNGVGRENILIRGELIKSLGSEAYKSLREQYIK